MKPSHHVIVSSGLGVIIAVWFNSWKAGAACFLSGVLIDLDHAIEYWLAKGKIPFLYDDLVDFCLNVRLKRIHLWFHSFELLVILWLLIFLFDLYPIGFGIGVGISTHIVCDSLFNPLRMPFYFLTYRFIKGFHGEIFYKKSNNQ